MAWVHVAQGLVEKGRGSEWMPKAASYIANGTSPYDGEAEEIEVPQSEPPPFTAYRYWSLYAEGFVSSFSCPLRCTDLCGVSYLCRGDDDYFHSSFTVESPYFAASPVPLLLLLSGDDEYYPSYLDGHEPKEQILTRWREGSEGKISPLSEVLRGASHNVAEEEAQEQLIGAVVAFLQRLDQESQ